MTRRPCRNHTPDFKSKVALAVVRGEQTLRQLAQQYDVHPNQIKQWRDQLLAVANGIFGRDKKSSSDEAHGDLVDIHRSEYVEACTVTPSAMQTSCHPAQSGLSHGYETYPTMRPWILPIFP